MTEIEKYKGMNMKKTELRDRIIKYIKEKNEITEDKINEDYSLLIPLLKDWDDLTLSLSIKRVKNAIELTTSLTDDKRYEILDSNFQKISNITMPIEKMYELITIDFIKYMEQIPSYRLKIKKRELK